MMSCLEGNQACFQQYCPSKNEWQYCHGAMIASYDNCTIAEHVLTEHRLQNQHNWANIYLQVYVEKSADVGEPTTTITTTTTKGIEDMKYTTNYLHKSQSCF